MRHAFGVPDAPETGRSAPTAKRRKNRRWLWTTAALPPLVVALLAMYGLYSARRDLVQGASELQRATTLISTQTILHGKDERRLRLTLSAARQHLSAAHARLQPWAPVLAHLGWLPGVGSELKAAGPAATAALYTANAASDLIDGLAPTMHVLATPHPGVAVLPRLLPALQRGRPDFQRAVANSTLALQAVRDLPPHTGVATLDHGTAQLRGRLPEMASIGRWLVAAPVVLGASGPSTYLVLVQDPRELRATGGFIGAAGYLSLRSGKVIESFTGSALRHEIGSVPLPAPEAVYTPEGNWIFRDSNWSPDFPTTAQTAALLYWKDTGSRPTGVVGVSDPFIVPLLAATGPVYIPQYHVRATAGTIEQLAQRFVNGAYHGPQGGTGDTTRKQFIGYAFQAVLNHLQSVPASRIPALEAVLAKAVSDRTLLLYDPRPQVAAAIRNSGADGTFRVPPGDFLGIVDDNRSYNKLNPYVTENATYNLSVRPDLTLEATLRIHYHVNPSPATLEGVGPFFGWEDYSKHDYQDFLRVFVPRGASMLAAHGLQAWHPDAAYGGTMLSGRVVVRASHSDTVILRYRLPANTLASAAGAAYRLTIYHQASANLHAITVQIHGTGGVTLGSGAARYRTVLPLSHDSRLTLPLHHTGRARMVRLPAPFYGDPMLPYAYLHHLGLQLPGYGGGS